MAYVAYQPTASPGSVLGVYAGPANVRGVATFRSLVGQRPKYVMDFLDGSSWSTIEDPAWFTSQWAGTGYQMIWGVPILPASNASLAQGATGAYDSHFLTLAKALVAQGQGGSIIRLGWEFNGTWFPWSAASNPQAFVDYWRQIVTTMRSVPGARFSFEWNPTRGTAALAPSLAWPGRAYVNIIGMDVYDLQWPSYPGPQAEWQHMLSEPYGLNWLASYAASKGKPIAFPEWGLWSSASRGGGDNAYFVSHMAGWIASHNVSNAIYWDYGTSSVAGGANPLAASALHQTFGLAPTGPVKAAAPARPAPPASNKPASQPAAPLPQPAAPVASSGKPVAATLVRSPVLGGWKLNGSAALAGSSLVLNPAVKWSNGSAFWPLPVASSALTVSFDAYLGGGSGANGMTLAFIDPGQGAGSLGQNGGGEGFASLKGLAVSLETYGAGPTNLIGLTDGQGPQWATLHYLATSSSIPVLRGSLTHVVVSLSQGRITVTVAGTQVIDTAATFPPAVLVGFTGSSGYFTDTHSVSNVTVSA